MVSGYGDFIFADVFDVVIALLEEDESMEEQFREVVQKVSIKIYEIVRLFSNLFRCRWFYPCVAARNYKY